MRLQLAPSILSFSPDDYRTPVAELRKAGVDWLHLDVMDGQFVPPITFGAELAKALYDTAGPPLEAHFMTRTPEAHFDAFIAAGCTRIFFHAEASDHSHYLCMNLRRRGIGAGVAINPATPIEAIRPLLGVMDAALVMTVNPGWGGQSLITECLDKVRILRTWAPDLDIEVDGGIDDSTLPEAISAGANLFVTGSYLTRTPSIAEGVQRLRSLCGS